MEDFLNFDITKKMNDNCKHKKSQWRQLWTKRDVEDERSYCMNAYTSYNLCESCANYLRCQQTLKLLPEKIDRIDKLEEQINSLLLRIEQLEAHHLTKNLQ
jgi:hypothetical protein